MFTITFTFRTNVATIPQKENEFLIKASLFTAGLPHFGYLVHLVIEFLIFLSDFFSQSLSLKIFLSFRKSGFLTHLGYMDLDILDTHTLISGCINFAHIQCKDIPALALTPLY